MPALILLTVGGDLTGTASGTLVHIDNQGDINDPTECEACPLYNKLTDYIGKFIRIETENGTDTPTYLHMDHLGSAQTGTSANGTVAWREQYTLLLHSRSSLRSSSLLVGETMTNPLGNADLAGYTGHIKDSATGLNYMQARYYDPLIGRFLSIDPVGFSPNQPFMFNRYTYVGNDPVNLTDPFGMAPYLGARPVKGSMDSHMYVVYNADYIGDPNATVVSWAQGKMPGSNKTALVSHSELAQGRRTETLEDDYRAWKSMSAKNLGVEVQSINASDATVEAVANATTGNPDYGLFPQRFTLSPGANSNSASGAVSNRSTQINNPGAPDQALPDRATSASGNHTYKVGLPGAGKIFQSRVRTCGGTRIGNSGSGSIC